jgi:protein-tyrosine phosphatase
LQGSCVCVLVFLATFKFFVTTMNTKLLPVETPEKHVLYMSPHDVYNIMQDDANSKLIIDLRSARQFSQSKLRTAVNIHLEDILAIAYGKHEIKFDDNQRDAIRQLVEATLPSLGCRLEDVSEEQQAVAKDLALKVMPMIEAFEGIPRLFGYHKKNSHYLILYDGDIHEEEIGEYALSERWNGWVRGDKPTPPGLARMYSQWLKWEGKMKNTCHCVVVRGGHASFQNRYPFLISTATAESVQGALASEIIDQFLFLGSQKNSKELRQLTALGITHIINMASELDNLYPDKYKYLKAGIDDTIEDSVMTVVVECIKYIEAARLENNSNRVLVHCAMGISRSSSIVIAYLMARNGWGFQQAYKYVRERRSSINPNPGFRNQLITNENFICSILNSDPIVKD